MIIFLCGQSRKAYALRAMEAPVKTREFAQAYVEATSLIGLDLRMVLVVVTGAWIFPHAGNLGQEKRCLITEDDGTGRNELYSECISRLPPSPSTASETVVVLISETSINDLPGEDVKPAAMLSACFDVASWFVDTLPHAEVPSETGLTKHQYMAFTLGVFAAALSFGLSQYGMSTAAEARRMEAAITGITIEKVAEIWAHEQNLRGLAQTEIMNAYMQNKPNMIRQISGAIRSVSDLPEAHPSEDPEGVLLHALTHSTRLLLL
ncbi:hypothetical protein [Acetobacter persici]|uniref:Uncharacterized protein n=1 Tax=Acetobacter persici TaxID=1076596 RepID=A0A1U9LJH8_9PROT|nr:hypothetical protein [Acetobacter persici]AQT06581.1 hypothetical protein A0U91_16365 [Acetobacter persici]